MRDDSTLFQAGNRLFHAGATSNLERIDLDVLSYIENRLSAFLEAHNRCFTT